MGKKGFAPIIGKRSMSNAASTSRSFFGTRSKSRAIRRSEFLPRGGGKFGAAAATWLYSAEAGTITLQPGAVLDPVAFPLKADDEFYLDDLLQRRRSPGRARSFFPRSGKTETIRFQGLDVRWVYDGFGPRFEIRNLKLRRVVKNPFDSQLWFLY